MTPKTTYIRLMLLICLAACLHGCGDDGEKQRVADLQRAEKVNDSILAFINSHWKFNVPKPSQRVADRLSGWNEWTAYMNELEQKPTNSLSGYRQKAANLVARANELNNNIPAFFNKPSVQARISVLQVKTKSLFTFINVEVVPQQKIVSLIGEISHDTAELERQLDEMVRLSEIPREQGEEEMLKALDTVRLADPNAVPQQNENRLTPQNNMRNTQMPPPPGHGAGFIRKN